MKRIGLYLPLLLFIAESCGQGEQNLPKGCFIEKYRGERQTPQALLDQLPPDLHLSPRLVIGRTADDCFHRPENYSEKTKNGVKFFISKNGEILYYDSDKGPFDKGLWKTIDEMAAEQGVKGASPVRDHPRELTLRNGDVTVDIQGSQNVRGPKGSQLLRKPHVQGNAWAHTTVQEIKNRHHGRFGAIVFERVSSMPLYWGAYLKELTTRKGQSFYLLPDEPTCMLPAQVEEFYAKNYHFYPPVVEKVALPNQLSSLVTTGRDLSGLVNTVAPNSTIFSEEKNNELQEILRASAPVGTEILKAYYDLLEPGGLFIFMSSSHALNKQGGCVFEYKDKYYSPFQDLDDPNMQAVYRSLLERAGFRNVQFYKDPYFMEDIIFVSAKK